MNKSKLLNKLDRATDRAASIVVKECYPISISKFITKMGEISIRKTINKTYDIILFERVLFSDIKLFDVALIIARKYLKNETSGIKQILLLEEKFIKYSTDMIHYLNCMKGAKKRKDFDRVYILEDKFRLSEQLAKNIKDKMLFLK